MKILIVNLDKAIFGFGSKSLEDLKDYSRVVGKIFVITWTLKNEQPIFFEDRLFVYPTNSKNKFAYFWDTFNIFKKHILKEKVEIISSQDPFETGVVAWIISFIFRIPLVIQIHTDFLSKYFWSESSVNKIRVLLGKFLVRRACRIRVASERIKKSLLELSPRLSEKVMVLPIFVDTEKIKNTLVKTDLHKKYPQFSFIMLMASRLSKEKNIGMAIEAAREVFKKDSKAGLVIVGDGPELKDLKSQISNLKLQNNVIVEPWVGDLSTYYKTADLFLLTSNYEGYGRTIVEAMAADCPVVMTDVGVAGEIIKNDYNGFVVPVGDSKKLVKAIVKFKADNVLNHLKASAEYTLKSFKPRKDYLIDYKELWKKCLKF